MLSGSMAKGGIGVSTAPGEDGNAIDDEIASTNEPTAQCSENGEDKQCFRQRCLGAIPPLPLLRGTRDAGTAILAQWQAAGQSQGRPVTEPIAHILIRKPPQGTQKRNEEQRLFAVRARRASRSCRQRGRTSVMSQAYGETAQGDQVQGVHQGQGIHV